MDSKKVSFQALFPVLEQRVEAGKIAASSVPNMKSALLAFLRERRIDVASPVGSVLRALYYRNRNEHCAALAAEGRTPEYIYNRKNLLGKWRTLVIEYDRQFALENNKATPFQQAILDILGQGYTLKGLARLVGMNDATLGRWRNGARPQGAALKYVPRLENALGLAPGALTALLCSPEKIEPTPKEGPVIDYRNRIVGANKDPYALTDPSPELRKEWTEFVRHKTSPFRSIAPTDDDTPRARMKTKRGRRAVWVKRVDSVKKERPSNWFTFLDGAYVPTAGVNWCQLSGFWGWLRMSADRGGLGITDERALSLAAVSRRTWVDEYVAWRVHRAQGIIHGGIIAFLGLVQALCHPKTGYLTLNWHKFAQKADVADAATWVNRCVQSHEHAKDLADELEVSPMRRASRDSFAPIEHILRLPNPLTAVVDMCVRMIEDRPTGGGTREAVWARNIMMVKLMTSNPLRIRSISELTYKPDNTGNLRRLPAGGWHIFISRRELKNHQGRGRREDYDQNVRPEVWPDIERYIRDYWPLLKTAPSHHLFISSETGSPMGEDGLGKRFAFLTAQYLDGCVGVGPHHMRHIVACSILKANPDGWAKAAAALHDEEATVRRHYARFNPTDTERWLAKVYDDAFARLR